MLNRWTYGWLGKPHAAPPLGQPLDSPPSPTTSYKTAHEYEEDSKVLPGAWVKPLEDLGESEEEAGGRFPPFPSLSSRQPSEKEQPGRRRIARFEDDPVSVPLSPPLHTPPAVSPRTLSRLKHQLATRTTPPRTDDPQQVIARDFAHRNYLNFPSTSDRKPREPSPLSSPLLETRQTLPRRTKPLMSDISTIKASRIHTQKPSWESDWKELVEMETRERSNPEEKPESTRTLKADERGSWSALFESPEMTLIEGTLLAPPPSFTSTREISRLHREYWIPCQAILSTEAVYLLMPSDNLSPLPSQIQQPRSASSATLVLELDECRSLNKPTDVKDRDRLYPFEIELEDGMKLYFATETANEWMTWTTTIRQQIDLVNGRAPPSPENASDFVRKDQHAYSDPESNRPSSKHLEDLRKMSEQLEEDSRKRGNREEDRTRLNEWMREMDRESALQQYEGQLSQSRSQVDPVVRNRDTSPRRLLKPRPQHQRQSTMVDATVQASVQPDTLRADRQGRTTSRRKYQGPDPKELLELFQQQQHHLEQSRHFQQDQGKALAAIIKDLHSNRETLYNTVPVLHQALSTIKEAQQAQADTLLAFAERLKSKTTQPLANSTRQQPKPSSNMSIPHQHRDNSQSAPAAPPSWARAAMMEEEESFGRVKKTNERSSKNGLGSVSAPFDGIIRGGTAHSKLRRASPERERAGMNSRWREGTV
ncbi:hypothetical protein JCM3765_004105 [Sporobolomyces pararoseus]